MELRMYRYRLYPSGTQRQVFINQFITCKRIYNELLALSIDAWKFGHVSMNRFDFNNYLSGRQDILYSLVRQNVSDRVHKAFQNFFRRVKSKAKDKGFPRFKSRVQSMTYPQSGFKFLSDKRLFVSKIGNIPIILHRVPKGKIKTMTIKCNKANQWFVIFSCELPDVVVKHQNNSKVGIDMGIESLAVVSDGQFIDNPRHLINSEKRLKLLQRRLSRKVKGSKNRNKAKFKVAKLHIKIANQRYDFLHKLSNVLTKKYSFIAVEDLKVSNMIQNHCLAKHIGDASWNNFVQMLSYKAITCGGQLVKVNPRNTSKTCSKCGTITEMSLSQREFRCSDCGFVCHRDLNASLNILNVGTDCAEHNACGDNASTTKLVASDVVESGTITEL